MLSEPADGSSQDATFKKGDTLGGVYEIYGLIGKGGFGEVYLAYFLEGKSVCALKTIRADLLADTESREAFKRECLLWVNLEEHPFIVAARLVHEFSRRLYVGMDCILPDPMGRLSLADHIAYTSGPLAADVTLKWAVQFCYGMEHAFQRGIKCHRDIKPTNILIAPDGSLKISDFGLALAAEMAWKQETGPVLTENGEGCAGLSLLVTDGKKICGTPGYIAPELLLGGGADVRSDIYSFGLVLWQMAKGSQVPPFHVPYDKAANIDDYLRRVLEQQIEGRIPDLGGAIQSVIERCLAPDPSQRYESFNGLRLELEEILFRRTGRTVEVPKGTDRVSGSWNNKGMSLDYLGRHEEALICYDKAIQIDPRDANALGNKGIALAELDRFEEAMVCFDEALRIDPHSPAAWINKGYGYNSLGRPEEALACLVHAEQVDPQNSVLWYSKGRALLLLARFGEAATCFGKSVQIDPRYADAWTGQAMALMALDRFKEAGDCLARAEEIDPQCPDDWKKLLAERGNHDMALTSFKPAETAWGKQGLTLAQAGKYEEALASFAKALEIDPRYGGAWHNRGSALTSLGRNEEAIACYHHVLEIDPLFAPAWERKAYALGLLGQYEEAAACLTKALELDPENVASWSNMGTALRSLGRLEEAVASYTKALEIDPRHAVIWDNKGSSLRGLNRHDEAIGCYTKALGIDPRNPSFWVHKGEALAEMSRLDEANKCFDKALEIDPAFTAALENKLEIIFRIGNDG
jgi:tetratricopeptide (TPR) repeat protein